MDESNPEVTLPGQMSLSTGVLAGKMSLRSLHPDLTRSGQSKPTENTVFT
jgi:hypothetical protein